MTSKQKTVAWTVTAVVFLAAVSITVWLRVRHRKPVVVSGAVMVKDSDPRKELPIADVEISVKDSPANATTRSDSSGFFALKLLQGLRRGQPVTLQFRHPNYQPLDLSEFVGNKLYLAHLTPLSRGDQELDNRPATAVGNVRVRYSLKAVQDVNIGSAVKTFEIVNSSNVPCKGAPPCSPDGKWKAAIGSTSLDAGAGNEFRDARVSCIAGPCPFTKIEYDGFSKSGQVITVSVRGWSDTATFLLEAEVFHKMPSEVIHESYPVIFGRALNFTVPIGAEGTSIEADITGETIIFPLGPALFLRWASCNARVNKDQTSVYRCELKPGFRFQG